MQPQQQPAAYPPGLLHICSRRANVRRWKLLYALVTKGEGAWNMAVSSQGGDFKRAAAGISSCVSCLWFFLSMISMIASLL